MSFGQLTKKLTYLSDFSLFVKKPQKYCPALAQSNMTKIFEIRLPTFNSQMGKKLEFP